MPKILITGGAGYIGSTTAHLLVRRGYRVDVVDDLSHGYQHNVQSLPFHKINLRDTASLSDLLALEQFDAVIHFAAYIAVGESTEKPELYFSNNLGGTVSLLDAMAKARIKRLVFSSTAAVYGIPTVIPIPEDAPLVPINPYGESKLAVERILGWLDRYSGLRSIALRYFNACGSDPESRVGEEHDPETHLIPLLLEAVRTGNPVRIFGDDYDTPDGTCIRDYIHVADLAETHVLALERLLAGGSSDVFNVGTGSGHSVLEVLRAVESVTGAKVPFTISARRAGDPAALVANSDKLKQAFHWTPKFSALDHIVTTAWQFHMRRAPTSLPRN
jgi:UDP-glucose 4-epimerase